MKEQDVQIEADLDMPGLTLFERLGIERRRLGLSEDEFAEQYLDASPSTWLAVRKGKRGASSNLYVSIVRRFPELEPFVYRHLKFRALLGGEE